MVAIKIFNDPYEYAEGWFEADHSLWLELFQVIDKVYGEKSEVFVKLHSFRTAGTSIKRGKSMYVLRPLIDPNPGGNSAWPDMKTYEEFRERHLVPYTEQIKIVLIELTKYQRWKDLFRRLIGKIIKTPAGEGILKDVSPYGAQVDLDGEIRTFEFGECEPF